MPIMQFALIKGQVLEPILLPQTIAEDSELFQAQLHVTNAQSTKRL
jgi:hypothetical protein